jgi:hypothetical protein
MKQNNIYLTLALVLFAVSTEVVTAQTTTKRADTLVLRTRSVAKKLVAGDSSATITLPSQSGTLAIEGSVSSLPIGTITTISRKASIPEGFVACDGQAISRSEYADLYSAIGTTYGAGNGSTTFNVPKLLDSYIPRDGLLAWWPFNGNANDEWIYGRNATVVGPVLTSDRFSNTNAAYSFDGVDDYMYVPSFNLDATMSLSLWVEDEGGYPNARSINPRYVSAEYCNGGFALFNRVNDAPNYLCFTRNRGNAADDALATFLLPANTLTHLCVTYDGATVKFYRNGELVNEDVIIGLIIEGGYLFFGMSGCTPAPNMGDYFNGTLDDVGFWNRVLSNDEVKQLYDAASLYVMRVKK